MVKDNTIHDPKGPDGKEIASQITSNQELGSDSQEVLKTGNLKVEQAPETIPESAEIVRQYAKWTDNDGNFHKVPLDGTTAIREPAHQQHEVTLEERDNLDQTLALKTPRRDNAKANESIGVLQDVELRNDEVNQALKDTTPVDSDEPKEGPVVGPDDHPEFGNNDGNVSDGFKTPGK